MTPARPEETPATPDRESQSGPEVTFVVAIGMTVLLVVLAAGFLLRDC